MHLDWKNLPSGKRSDWKEPPSLTPVVRGVRLVLNRRPPANKMCPMIIRFELQSHTFVAAVDGHSLKLEILDFRLELSITLM